VLSGALYKRYLHQQQQLQRAPRPLALVLDVTCGTIGTIAFGPFITSCYAFNRQRYINPLTPTVTIWVKHPVPGRVKPPVVIFDFRAL